VADALTQALIKTIVELVALSALLDSIVEVVCALTNARRAPIATCCVLQSASILLLIQPIAVDVVIRVNYQQELQQCVVLANASVMELMRFLF